MFFRQKKSGDRTYLQIVENRWQDGGSKQRVICTLGRLDELEASGQLERLLSSGAKYSESMMVIDAHSRGEAPVIAVRRIGPGLIFERLMEGNGVKRSHRRSLCRSQVRVSGGAGRVHYRAQPFVCVRIGPFLQQVGTRLRDHRGRRVGSPSSLSGYGLVG